MAEVSYQGRKAGFGNELTPSGVFSSMRLNLLTFVVCLAVLATACGADPDTSPSSSVPDDGASSTSTTAPGTGPVGEGEVLIAALGTLLPYEGGVKLCPPGHFERCPYMDVVGEVDPALVTNPDDPGSGFIVRAVGRYDGRRLFLTESPTEVEGEDIDFTTPCEDKRGRGKSGNSPDAMADAIATYAAEHADTYAIWWWDSANGVANVWFKGDAEVHRQALEEVIDSGDLCVIGGADYSEAELQATSRGFFDAYNRGEIDLAVSSGSAGSLSNRVEISLEAIDEPTIVALRQRFGPSLEFQAMIEVIGGTLADLPVYVPVGPDEIAIETADTRSGGGMQALGRFTLGYDQDLDCFYLGSDGERILPVWPFGYSAGREPLAIYDQDGVVAVVPGEMFEAGGGHVGLERVEVAGDCGATGAWIFSSHPTMIVEG